MKNKVFFIGVGAVKSGSTWMGSLLAQHPEVCMSYRKEIAYFNTKNFNGTKNESSEYGIEYYLQFWPKTEKIKGEISPQYLFDVDSPRRIKDIFPDTHILMMLRNPKEVVYSHYLYEKYFNQSINASKSFIDALSSSSYLLKSAFFTEQIQRYFDIFDRDKIHIYFLDEALDDPSLFSRQLYQDLNLKDINFKPDYSSKNNSKQIKSKWIHFLIVLPSVVKKMIEKSFLNRVLKKVRSSMFFIRIVNWRNNMLDRNVKLFKKPNMTKEEKLYLDGCLNSEIESLEKLLGVNLSRWKTID